LIVGPTFTLINEYTEDACLCINFDLYRTEPKEVALHPETYWEGVEFPLGIVAEWAERLPYLPPSYMSVCLSYQSGGERRVDLWA